jgi:RNA polymerase sigma-54 factor
MEFSPRLDLRQSQSLVMSPRMQQAVKLLALSNLELETHVAELLEGNPLLEIGGTEREAGTDPAGEGDADRDGAVEAQEPEAGSGADGADALDLDDRTLDPERGPGDQEGGADRADAQWSAAITSGSPDDPGFEAFAVAQAGGLAEHLVGQLSGAARDAREHSLAALIIGELDEAGYLRTGSAALAAEFGVPENEIERAVELVQSLDPPGIGARSLAECLALQAKAADRYDPCMARLIDHIDLVAAGELARLRRLCEVDDEDFVDMIAELRCYDPRPGLAFGSEPATAVTPDVLVRPDGSGGWHVSLNEASLPRLVVNRDYYVELKAECRDRKATRWLDEQLAEADWLMRALDQRQRTILKTAASIVELQGGFFREGVRAMRSLTLRDVAEAIDMHESTVSRATAGKYVQCPRGTFALSYFFSSGVAGSDGETASSEAVKARIRTLIDAEDARAVLSDDALVTSLKSEGFDIARRTVAKYREAMGIGSSVERRRAKKLLAC